jgi:hypothetical protein
LVNNSFCYTLAYGGGIQLDQNIATRNRFNCVNNSGDYLLYQYINAAGGGTIDEMNVVNNEATQIEYGILLCGGTTSPLDRNYNKCVFINNKFSYFAVGINIDFYYSIFDVNTTTLSGAVINQKDGCVVGKDNLETKDFVDIKTL